MNDDHGAFLPGLRLHRQPTAAGPLSGLTFAVKDLIDVQASVTGGGNPDWAAAHAPAERDAPVVARLLEAGATLAGKTISDEFAFSLEGENAHYGTPRNPRAVGRLPGGSSSGSAVAVAAGRVDFALGTDTGGSVRVPAAFCGVCGFRPTHGAVPLEGVLPFAPSYDTVGWFARDAELLQQVGAVLLPAGDDGSKSFTLHVATDAFAAIDADAASRLLPIAEALADGPPFEVFEGPSAPWLQAYATLQGAEIRTTVGPWIATHRPRLGANIAPRFAGLAAINDDDVRAAQTWRKAQRERLVAWLSRGRILLLPTAPGPALATGASTAERERFYTVALALGSIAGHAGLPQVSLPLSDLDGLPLGLSLLGPPGSDRALLALAQARPLTPTRPLASLSPGYGGEGARRRLPLPPAGEGWGEGRRAPPRPEPKHEA